MSDTPEAQPEPPESELPETQIDLNPPPEPLPVTRAEALFGVARGTAAEPEPLPTPEELQRSFPQYEILTLLGRGGMGVVYKAKHKGLDRFVAIKLLPPELGDNADFTARFQREARAMARLEHPNIITVYDYGQTAEGRLYFVMEFVDGANLAELIRSGALSSVAHAAPGVNAKAGCAEGAGDLASRGGPREPQPALDPLTIAAQLCDALAYAHGEGIVHRDIKPANVMLDRKGRVKVADFGLARIIAAEIDATALTTTGTVMGTLDYMAPEQRKGMHVDHRADIYSLGVMLYEMFCGEVPHGIFDPPSTKAKCDPRVDTIITRALQQQPEQRFQSTAEMKAAVDEVNVAHAAPGVNSTSRAQRADAGDGRSARSGDSRGGPREPRGRRTTLIAALLVLALLVGGGWFLAAKKPAPSAHRVDATQPAPIKLWDAPEKLPKEDGIRWEDGAVRIENNHPLRAYAPASRDAILRVSAKNVIAGGATLFLRVRRNAGSDDKYGFGIAKDGFWFDGFRDGKVTMPRRDWPHTRTHNDNDWLRLELRIVGDTITASVDGETVATVRDATISEPGGMMLTSPRGAYFRDIEYVPLDGGASAANAPVGRAGPARLALPTDATPAAEPWQEQLAALKDNPLSPSDYEADGTIRSEHSFAGHFPASGARDVGIRLRLATRNAATPRRHALWLRTTDKATGEPQRQYVLNFEDTVCRVQYREFDQPQGYQSIKAWLLPERFSYADEHTYEFRAIGDVLSVRLDGVELGSVRDTRLPGPGESGFSVEAGDHVSSIQTLCLEPDSKTTEPWHDWIAEMRKKDFFRPAAGMTDDGTSITMTGGGQHFALTSTPVRNAVIRLVATGSETARLGAFHLRTERDPATGQAQREYQVSTDEAAIRIQLHEGVENGGTYRSLTKFVLPADYYRGRHGFECQIVDDLLSVRLDGREVGTLRDGTLSQPGHLGAYLPAGFVVHELRWRSLDR